MVAGGCNINYTVFKNGNHFNRAIDFLVAGAYRIAEDNNVRGIQHRIKYYSKMAGFKVTCHQLHHAMATQMLNADADIETIQDLLGHACIRTTARHLSFSIAIPAHNEAMYLAHTLDHIHRLTKTSFTLQIIKASLMRGMARCDDQLTFKEDLQLIRDARRFGRFFYIPTKTVHTSTRRSEPVSRLRPCLLSKLQTLFVSTKRAIKIRHRVVR